MASLPHKRYTPEEYLEMERAAEFKSEYISGEILGMAGASESHNIINLNIAAELRTALRGGRCLSMANEMKVNIGASFFYPDVLVACGERQYLDHRRDVLLNPVVIIEVRSPSTERYDRTYKLARYMLLPSVRDIVFIAQDDICIEHFSRDDAGDWRTHLITEADARIDLASIDCSVPVQAIYLAGSIPAFADVERTALTAGSASSEIDGPSSSGTSPFQTNLSRHIDRYVRGPFSHR